MATVQDQITAAAQRYNVSPALALAVAERESRFNQAARGISGEIGIFQLMPSTAGDLGVNPYDAAQNIEGGVRYLRLLLDRYGNTETALQAYNGGMGNVDRGTVSAAARRYAQEILSLLGFGQSSTVANSGSADPPSFSFSPVSLSDFAVSLPASNPWLMAALALAGVSVLWLLVFREA